MIVGFFIFFDTNVLGEQTCFGPDCCALMDGLFLAENFFLYFNRLLEEFARATEEH